MPFDLSQYPPDWPERRARILARADNRCEWCGVPNGVEVVRAGDEWAYEVAELSHRPDVRLVKIILTIAHLDHDKRNWSVRDDRLAALCQRCHLNYDRPRHIAHARAARRRRSGQMELAL